MEESALGLDGRGVQTSKPLKTRQINQVASPISTQKDLLRESYALSSKMPPLARQLLKHLVLSRKRPIHSSVKGFGSLFLLIHQP
jgi:hypothetical protein